MPPAPGSANIHQIPWQAGGAGSGVLPSALQHWPVLQTGALGTGATPGAGSHLWNGKEMWGKPEPQHSEDCSKPPQRRSSGIFPAASGGCDALCTPICTEHAKVLSPSARSTGMKPFPWGAWKNHEEQHFGACCGCVPESGGPARGTGSHGRICPCRAPLASSQPPPVPTPLPRRWQSPG